MDDPYWSAYHACEFHWDRTKPRFLKMAAMTAILDVTWPPISAWRPLLVRLLRLQISLRLEKVEVFQDGGYGGHIGCHVTPNFGMDDPYWSPYHAWEFHWDRTKLRFFKMVAMAAILDVTWPSISAWMILIGPPTTPANFIAIGQSWVQDGGYGGHIGCYVTPNFGMDDPNWSPYHAWEFHWDRTKLKFFKMVAMAAILDVTWPQISAWTILFSIFLWRNSHLFQFERVNAI
jgi:hypothetical protein